MVKCFQVIRDIQTIQLVQNMKGVQMVKWVLGAMLALSSMSSFAAAQKVELAVEDKNYFPLSGTYDSDDKPAGQYVGVVADMFKLFNKSQSEFELVVKPYPIKRLIFEYLKPDSLIGVRFPDDKDWDADFKKTSGYQDKLVYSEPVIAYTDGAFVLESNKNIDLTKLTSMGLIGGFSPDAYDAQIKSKQIRLEDSLNTVSLLGKLVQKKVDAIYINKFIGLCKLGKLKDAHVVFSEVLPHRDSSYRLSSVKFPKLVTTFNKFLKEKGSDIEQIKQDYLKNNCN